MMYFRPMPNITVCLEEDLLIYAAKLLIDKQIDSIPVVKKHAENQMKVLGRITKTTITRAFVSLIEDD